MITLFVYGSINDGNGMSPRVRIRIRSSASIGRVVNVLNPPFLPNLVQCTMIRTVVDSNYLQTSSDRHSEARTARLLGRFALVCYSGVDSRNVLNVLVPRIMLARSVSVARQVASHRQLSCRFSLACDQS